MRRDIREMPKTLLKARNYNPNPYGDPAPTQPYEFFAWKKSQLFVFF